FLQRLPTFFPTPHCLPFVSHHDLGIGLELASETYACGLRILGGVAEQVSECGGLQIDGHTDLLELLPRNDDDKGEQHGIQRPYHLEFGTCHLVIRFEHFDRHESANEEQTGDRKCNSKANNCDA